MADSCHRQDSEKWCTIPFPPLPATFQALLRRSGVAVAAQQYELRGVSQPASQALQSIGKLEIRFMKDNSNVPCVLCVHEKLPGQFSSHRKYSLNTTPTYNSFLQYKGINNVVTDLGPLKTDEHAFAMLSLKDYVKADVSGPAELAAWFQQWPKKYADYLASRAAAGSPLEELDAAEAAPTSSPTHSPVQQHDLQQADAEDLTQADTTSDDSSVSDEESEDPGEAEDPDFDPRHPDGLPEEMCPSDEDTSASDSEPQSDSDSEAEPEKSVPEEPQPRGRCRRTVTGSQAQVSKRAATSARSKRSKPAILASSSDDDSPIQGAPTPQQQQQQPLKRIRRGTEGNITLQPRAAQAAAGQQRCACAKFQCQTCKTPYRPPTQGEAAGKAGYEMVCVRAGCGCREFLVSP